MHLLDRHDGEITEEANILKHSPFYSEQKFINILKKVGLCVLDLNIQNIYSKLDEFELFVARANIHNPISVICLNECWINKDSDMSTVQLHNYTMFYRPVTRKGHSHCGLVLYMCINNLYVKK